MRGGELCGPCVHEHEVIRVMRGPARAPLPRAPHNYTPAVYQALLTRRYLFSKVMPLLAALAVMLCTAMVLIVWSVMGGFLTMLLASGRTLQSDVTITWPTATKTPLP